MPLLAVTPRRLLLHQVGLTCGFCITRWSVSPSKSLGFHVDFVLGAFHFLSARFIQLPSSRRFLIICPRSLRPWDICARARTARTVGDDRGKLVSDLSSTRLLAFDVHNLSQVLCRMLQFQFWLALLTTTRWYNASSRQSNFL